MEKKRRKKHSARSGALCGLHSASILRGSGGVQEIQKKRNERPDVRAKAREMNLAYAATLFLPVVQVFLSISFFISSLNPVPYGLGA
jgi:hypothetical protein